VKAAARAAEARKRAAAASEKAASAAAAASLASSEASRSSSSSEGGTTKSTHRREDGQKSARPQEVNLELEFHHHYLSYSPLICSSLFLSTLSTGLFRACSLQSRVMSIFLVGLCGHL
jgi:hypothetical protein